MNHLYIFIALASFFLGSCVKKDDASTGLVKVCTEVGQRCLYTAGKMGICNESHDTDRCTTTPCLKCTSQH